MELPLFYKCGHLSSKGITNRILTKYVSATFIHSKFFCLLRRFFTFQFACDFNFTLLKLNDFSTFNIYRVVYNVFNFYIMFSPAIRQIGGSKYYDLFSCFSIFLSDLNINRECDQRGTDRKLYNCIPVIVVYWRTRVQVFY